jgi:RNA polymerase sigma factor (sigma-70 family)
MATANHIENQIIAFLRDDNQEGISLLYDYYATAINGVIFKIVNNDDIAEELLQDTFVKVWRFRAQYDATKGRFFTWILNIARNTAIDHTRLKSFQIKNQNIDNVVSSYDMQNSERPNIDVIGINEVVKNLPKEHQEIIQLVYFQGFTHIEAAEELNIPLGTLKTRLRLAIIELRKIYDVSSIILGIAFGFF